MSKVVQNGAEFPKFLPSLILGYLHPPPKKNYACYYSYLATRHVIKFRITVNLVMKTEFRKITLQLLV